MLGLIVAQDVEEELKAFKGPARLLEVDKGLLVLLL
jgi:hypothetical protein